MNIPHATEPISPLRQRLIDDMDMRKLSLKTQSQYIRAIKRFSKFYGHSPNGAVKGLVTNENHSIKIFT